MDTAASTNCISDEELKECLGRYHTPLALPVEELVASFIELFSLQKEFDLSKLDPEHFWNIVTSEPPDFPISKLTLLDEKLPQLFSIQNMYRLLKFIVLRSTKERMTIRHPLRRLLARVIYWTPISTLKDWGESYSYFFTDPLKNEYMDILQSDMPLVQICHEIFQHLYYVKKDLSIHQLLPDDENRLYSVTYSQASKFFTGLFRVCTTPLLALSFTKFGLCHSIVTEFFQPFLDYVSYVDTQANKVQMDETEIAELCSLRDVCVAWIAFINVGVARINQHHREMLIFGK